MTYVEALKTTSARIKEHQVNPSDALELLCFVLNIKREQFYIETPSKQLTAAEQETLDQVITDYVSGKPLAYITGKTEFLGNEILVVHGVLIPRPETELLVEKFLNDIKNEENVTLLEIGTGSGCIISSVTKALSAKDRGFTAVGIDPSLVAYQTTCKNIASTMGIKLEPHAGQTEYHDKKIRIKAVNLPIQDYRDDFAPTHIISNPPYITSTEMGELDSSVKDFEPALALDGGPDGLNIYREIAEYIKTLPYLPKLYLEISPVIAANVQQLFNQVGYEAEIHTDQFDRERFLITK
jgi:release factor glutamine methyltransferase